MYWFHWIPTIGENLKNTKEISYPNSLSAIRVLCFPDTLENILDHKSLLHGGDDDDFDKFELFTQSELNDLVGLGRGFRLDMKEKAVVGYIIFMIPELKRFFF